MERKQSKKSAWILALLMLGAFTLAFQFGAVGALAQTLPDQDLDGLSDTLENSGFALTPGMSMATDAGTFVTSVTKCGTGSTRQNCVDPAKQDLFVIIQRATRPCPTSCSDPCGPPLFPNVGPYGSDIAMPLDYPNQNIYGSPLGPLRWVSKITTGFTTHEIYQNPPSATQLVTQATGGWYAVKIVEDLNPCSAWLGYSTPGTITPVVPGSGTVWPEKIMNWIDTACSQACFADKSGLKTCYYVPVLGVSVPTGYVLATGKFTCTNANNSAHSVDMKAANLNLTPLYHDMIQNIISHETSHLMHLAFGLGTSADNHWPAAQGTLMEQSIGTKATKAKSGDINVTLYISASYAPQDPAQHALK